MMSVPWLHCNSCLLQFEKDPQFGGGIFVSECLHILCQRCGHQCQHASCPVCGSGGPKRVLPLGPKLGKNVIEMFTKPLKREDFKQTAKVFEYQVDHAKR